MKGIALQTDQQKRMRKIIIHDDIFRKFYNYMFAETTKKEI